MVYQPKVLHNYFIPNCSAKSMQNLVIVKRNSQFYHTDMVNHLEIAICFALYYPASRVFFDLPRLVGKRKKTLPTASSFFELPLIRGNG